MFYKDVYNMLAWSISMQDIFISNWTNPTGIAIDLGVAGPNLIMDTTLTNSPNSTNSPIKLHGTGYKYTQVVTSSNVIFDGSAEVFEGKNKSQYLDIPTDKKSVLSDATQSFLDSTTINEKQIIEVVDKTDKGIQKAINNATNGSVVYLPIGQYTLNSTIQINKPNIIIEGSGLRTYLSYKNGNSSSTLFHIANAQGTKIKNMSFNNKNLELPILDDSDDDIEFDRLHVHYKNDLIKIKNSKATIHLGQISGRIQIENSGDATVLAEMQLGNVWISGKKGNGFYGFY